MYEFINHILGWVFNVPPAKRKRRSTEAERSARIASAASASLPFVTSSLKATARIDEGKGTIPLIGHEIIRFPVDDGIEFLVAQIETTKNIIDFFENTLDKSMIVKI